MLGEQLHSYNPMKDGNSSFARGVAASEDRYLNTLGVVTWLFGVECQLESCFFGKK